jgi:hypothetical protein
VITTREFERDLADLTPQDFEQLVYAVVRREHPDAVKLAAPDFGADVVDDPASKKPRVWQVKHYPDDIHWTDCEKSLARATQKWAPGRVTFVFPQDLTGKNQQDFTVKLVTGKPVPVDSWAASRLNDELEKHPAIRRSYFPHRTEVLHEVLKAANLAERPVDGPAFLQHGMTLAGLVEELDPHFDYELRNRPDHLPPVSWEQPPFMTATLRGEGKESVMAAFVKSEADPVDLTWTFTDDEAGERARLQLYRALGRGEPVALNEGVTVRATPAPLAIREVIDEVQREVQGQSVLTIEPAGDTVPVTLVLEGEGALARRLIFEMRSAPPKNNENGAWVGISSGVLLYLGFTETGPDSVRFEVSPLLDLGPSPALNALATNTMLDLLTHPLLLEGPLFGQEARLDLGRDMSEEDYEPLRFLNAAYEALIEIEARTGDRFHLPETLGNDAAVAAVNLAALLRDKKTTGRSNLRTTVHVHSEQVQQVASRMAESRQLTVPFEHDLLDHTVRHGWARITYEKLTVGLQQPDQNGLVNLRVEAAGEAEIQLIDEPLPSDVAIDLATGRWRTTVL